MKLKHTLKRDGCTLSGRILETIFEGDEDRGDSKVISIGKVGKGFKVKSISSPDLYSDTLYVFGENDRLDNDDIGYTYDSEQEAQAMLDAINSITIKEPTVPEEKWVYVSDESEEDALKCKNKKLLLADLGCKFETRYIAVMGLYSDYWKSWTYAVPVPATPVKKLRQVEMTDEEYERFINNS